MISIFNIKFRACMEYKKQKIIEVIFSIIAVILSSDYNGSVIALTSYDYSKAGEFIIAVDIC